MWLKNASCNVWDLARLPDARLEKKILFATVWPEGKERGKKTGPTLRQCYWHLIRAVLGGEASQLQSIACRCDGTVWRQKLAAGDTAF